jgi:diguanylate cyclase (GGDEF)-like protein
LISLLLLSPILALHLQRRAAMLAERLQQSRDDTVAIMESALAVSKRAAKDWGHWDDPYRYMRGENPTYVTNNLATAALFDGGAVMVLLNPDGSPRLAFAHPNFRQSSYAGLVHCLQANRGRLTTNSSTIRLACRNSDGGLYLGAATPVTNNDASAPAAGTIAMFDPVAKPDYAPRIRQRMISLQNDLILEAPGGKRATPILPAIHGENGQQLGLRHPPLLALLGHSILDDLPVLIGVAGVATALRAIQMLERRRRALRDLQVERKANQRIRRTCHELEQLIEGLGRDLPQADAAPELPAPDLEGSTPVTERRLARATRRFHQVLAQTRSLALQDPLTGLPNRRHFIEQLEARLRRPLGDGLPLALLFVDVDRFKAINDRYGHAIGDGVLQTVTRRLREVLRPQDVIARFGGDELALSLDLSDLEDPTPARLEARARLLADRLADTMREPILVEGRILQVRLSIGFSLVASGDTDIDTALRRSDEAMYAVKRQRRLDQEA